MTLQVRVLLLGLAVLGSGRTEAADPAGRVPQAEPLQRAEGPGVVRSWSTPDRKSLVQGELVGWAGDRVEIKEQRTGNVRTFAIAEISAADRQWIKHWSEPTKRPALRRFGAHVRCQDDGSIVLLFGQTDTTDADFAHVKALPEVTEVGLIDCRVTDVGLASLKDLPRLRRLAISNTGVYGSGFEHLAGLKSLETFEYAAGDDDIKIAPHLQHLSPLKLKNLTLKSCVVGAEGLPHIGKLTELESLELTNCSVKSGLAPLAGLTKLRKLDLSYNRIPVADFGSLGAFTELRELNISGGGMTPAGAAHIAKLTKLERLVMPPTTDNDTVAVLTGLENLKFLKLPEGITLKGLAHTGRLKKLETLAADYDGMFFSDVFRVLGKDAGRPTGRVLELLSALHREGDALTVWFRDNPKMTAADLRCLSDVPEVRHLIFAPGVNDEGLAHVKGLKKLESVELPQSAVTDAGLALPNALP